MKKSGLTLLLAVIFSGCLLAQYIVSPNYFEVTGVSNQGVVAGYESWAGPYSLWNPDANTYVQIGGVAPGNGGGGQAQFSADGNYISGMQFTDFPISTDWFKYELSDYNYIFKALEFPPSGGGVYGYAAGQSLTYNGNGIVLKTNDSGSSWTPMWVDSLSHGLEAMSFPTDITGYVGGWNQYFAKTTDGGWSWTPLNPAGTDDVYIYTGIAFKDEMNGVVTAQLNDGVGVYITADGGETWTPGSGLLAVPYKVTYVSGDTYFLVTNDGHIEKSVNNGLTWNSVYFANGALLLGIRFFNDQTGVATGESNIYKTVDGGINWTPQTPNSEVLWRDVDWLDESHLVLVGTPDIIYESSDGGANWTWANQALSTLNPALYDISIAGRYIQVCGSQGTFYRRSMLSSLTVSEMARYDATSQQWTTLGSLGIQVDNNTSSGWDISGDGQTVVGNSWATGGSANAVAWNATHDIIDLGTMFEGRSTRANAVNQDGSLIVGYQDFNGPWKSAVWQINPQGGYFPNHYLLIDPNGSATDENNQLGMAQAVSGDGNWIGGQGDWANNGDPWLWSQDTGYVSAGNMPNGIGTIMGLNYNGSLAVGYFDMGFWDPRIPFIKIGADSLQNLNDYITATLGYNLGTGVIYTPVSLSRNGQYIAGWGFDPGVGEFGQYFTFRLQLPGSAIDDPTPEIARSYLLPAYPNPLHHSATITYVLAKSGALRLEVFNTKGELVRTLANTFGKAGRHSVSWDGKDEHGRQSASGMYLYRMQSGRDTFTRKMMLLR